MTIRQLLLERYAPLYQLSPRTVTLYGHTLDRFRDFLGREAVLAQQERGADWEYVGLAIEDVGDDPLGGDPITIGDRWIGYVTSAMWSPAAKANIALAMIESEHLKGEVWAEIYYEKELRQYEKVARCKIVEKPFWAPERARLTPPPPY